METIVWVIVIYLILGMAVFIDRKLRCVENSWKIIFTWGWKALNNLGWY
jgi:hypothetical protein